MTRTLPTIEDITRETVSSPTRPIGDDGLVKLEYSDDGFIQLYEQDFFEYGKSTVGIVDRRKVNDDDWGAIRTKFDLHHKDGTVTRHYCIGGSSAGVCKGDNLYKTEQELYEEIKENKRTEFSTSQQFSMEYGNSLEELVALGFSAKTGLPVYRNSTIFFNRRTGFMVANVDFFTKLNDQIYVLEIKTTNYNGLKNWENNSVPASYYDQAVLHYPRVLEDLNVAGTFFCCAYNNNLDDLIIRKCDRDITGENELEEAERQFVDYLQKGVEPPLLPIEGERAVNRFLSTHPIANDTTFSLPEVLSDIVKQYMDLYEEKSIFEKSARQIGKEADLINWVKIVYPTSIIQTEKAMLELGSYCQYRVKIYLEPEKVDIPNIFEGPVIVRDESNFFTGERNYIATARTMAIGNALRHCGFGSQYNDEYTVLPNNADTQGQAQKQQSQQEQQSTTVYTASNDTQQVTVSQQDISQPIDTSGITIDEAANCPIEYRIGYSGRRYCEHVQLGKYLNIQPDKAPRFFTVIVNTPDMCTEYTKACASVLLAEIGMPTAQEAAKRPFQYVEGSARTRYLGEPIGKILEVDKAFLERAVNSKSVDIKSKRAIKVLLDSVNAK